MSRARTGHIAGRRDQVRFVHDDGGEAALEKMPRPSPARVDEVGIAPVRLADRQADLICRGKNGELSL